MSESRTFAFTRRGALATGLAAAALAGCSRQRPFHAADAQPDGYPTVDGVREMARLMEERSGGRLKTKIFAGAQLGAEKDTIEITVMGGLDFNRINSAPLNSVAPETRVAGLPFIFRDEDHMRRAMDGAPGEQILASLEPHRMIGLCFYDSGARCFYTRDREINTPEDLKGQKIRVQNSDLYVSMVQSLGGDATPMPYGEVYQGLLQGVVDGAENNWPSYYSSRHFEVAQNYSLTRHVMAPEVLTMSARTWAKLSDEDRALIRQCAKDSVPVMRAIWDKRSQEAEQAVREAGVVVIAPDTAPFAARVQPVWDKYLTTPALRKLAEDIVNMGDGA